MGGRVSVLLVATSVALAACGEKDSVTPTSPEFAPARTCDFTKVSQYTRNEFGSSSAEAGYAAAMKNAGAGTDGATYNGYLILQSIGTKFDAQDESNSLSTANAGLLVPALQPCMNTGGAAVPSSAVVEASLQFKGAFGVRGLVPADKEPLRSHNGAAGWLLEPPGHLATPPNTGWVYDKSWQEITTLKQTDGTTTPPNLVFTDSRLADAMLVYAQATVDPNFTSDTPLSDRIDWSTSPAAVFDPGVVVGECGGASAYMQHFPKSDTRVEVVGFVKPSCFQGEVTLSPEAAPRTFAERVLRFFSPPPVHAAAVLSTGTGTQRNNLSPYEVVGPDFTVLAPGFDWTVKKPYYTVNSYFRPIVNYQVKTEALTKFKQQYILVWLEATNNSGSKVLICNNYAYTNADGMVQLPFAYLNKPGGYFITTKIGGAFSLTTQNGVTVVVPTVPPPLVPLTSPSLNVKNDVTKSPPDDCSQTFNGDLSQPPAYPGPNVF